MNQSMVKAGAADAALMNSPALERWTAAERLLSLPPGWRILRGDGISRLDPLPSARWYQRFYNEFYLTDRENPVYPGDAKFEERKLDYFARRIRRMTRYLGRMPETLLDIGPGDGLFLVAARRAGIAATGLEISAQARADARARHDVSIVLGDLLESRRDLRRRYDAVVMNHTLEHLLTPVEYLARMRELLAPDGLLVFEIPQQFINPIDLVYRAFRVRRPLGAYSLHHPYFHTVSSTRRLMDLSGFRIERLTTWLPGQVFHIQNRWITTPLQTVLWLADRLARRGHIIEVFANPR